MKHLTIIIWMIGLMLLQKSATSQTIKNFAAKSTIKDSNTGLQQLLPAADPSSETPTDAPCNCPKFGSNFFDPYTGNAHREIKDLEVWGGAGEPLVWKRYGNSRSGVYSRNYGNAHNWNSSYQYDMRDTTVDNLGRSQVFIHYPEGGQNLYVKISTNQWAPQAGMDKKLFQDGSHFFLQTSTGYRYHFEKIGTGTGNYYQLQDFRDSYQILYQLLYNSDRTLDRITEPAGRYLKLAYATVSGFRVISQVSTKDGRSVKYKYKIISSGTVGLDSVKYGDGTSAVYTYSSSRVGGLPNLENAVDPRYEGDAVNIKYTYSSTSANGTIEQEKNGATGEVMATLVVNSMIRTVCYANGRTQKVELPFNMLGRIKTYTDGVGNKIDYNYAQSTTGFISTQIDGLGRITTYNSRTIYGNLLEITYPDGGKEKWTRDDLDLELSHTDELGRMTTYTRDSRHRITRINNPDHTYETFTYNDFSQVLDHRLRNGGVEHNEYDGSGLKTSFTDALGNKIEYSYDAFDRLAKVTDARGNSVQYEYNERGLLIREVNADLSFKTYGYDTFGNRTSITNELGQSWVTPHDIFRRPISKSDPLNRTTVYSYDLPGVCGCSHEENKPTKITLPSGKVIEIQFDVEWRKIRETVGAGSPDAAFTSYEYDVVGNLVAVIDPRGKSWRTEVDVRNRRKSETTALGNTSIYTYDAVGNVLTIRRPDFGITLSVYDSMNRVSQITDPKGQVTKMTYDADGNMIELTDPKNNVYDFEYDLLDRKTKMIYPGGTFEQYTYDVVGNLITYKNRNSDIRTYTYDIRNREILSDWSDATPDISKTYDFASRLITVTSNVSALSYTYNHANELLSETQNITGAGVSKTVTYTYNADGLRNAMTYPGGTAVIYNYTGRNQVLSIAADGAPPIATYSYDLNGNRLNKTLNNGTNTNYKYDDANRMLSVDNRKAAVSFSRYHYAYDNVNRRKYVQYDNDKGDVYGYDATNQVTDVKYDVASPEGIHGVAARTVNYLYDASGNRTSLTDDGIATNYTTNNLNQYTAIGANALTNTINGNLQSYDGWIYTYDAQNRMIKAQNVAASVDFVYDARNRCVKRTINGAATYFYFEDWDLIEESDSADVQVGRYVHGIMLDEILTKVSATNTIYYHHNALGSVTQLTDVNADVAEKYSYDVFGTATIWNSSGVTISNSAFGNRFLFTGREIIKEIKLYDYRCRMYSPKLGRFLQIDPIRFEARDKNLYRYVKNNGVNVKDPLGLDDEWPPWLVDFVTTIVGPIVPGSEFATALGGLPDMAWITLFKTVDRKIEECANNNDDEDTKERKMDELHELKEKLKGIYNSHN